jgi:APA family basic amino acid/polyamine antiporter
MTTEAKPGTHELPRVLGLAAAMSCVVGSVIGSGIFIVPARIAKNVPYFGGIALVWVVGGLFSMAGSLTLAELSAMIPRAGGPYVYLKEAFGRLPAFLFGWSEFLVIRAGSVATLAAAFAVFFSQLVPAPFGMDPRLWSMMIALAAMATVAAINVIGTRVGGGVQVVGTLIKVAALGLMIVLPFALGQADPARLSPIWPSSSSGQGGLFSGFMVALISVLWAYDGWVNAGNMAEDIAEPGKNVPRALVWGMALLIGIYLAATLAYHLVVPLPDSIALADAADKTARPIAAEFFGRLVGPWGPTIIAVVVMSSIYIALNGNALSGPRAYFAMARDGLFPRVLCAIHPKFQTPANAILAQTAWSMTLTVLGTLFLLVKPPDSGLPRWASTAWATFHKTPLYDVLYTYVIFGATIFYSAAIASVFVLRKTLPDMPRPYRTWGYPITPALYLIGAAVLLTSMLRETPFESLTGLGIIALGLPAYLFFARQGHIHEDLST